jgi:hypothetical protein
MVPISGRSILLAASSVAGARVLRSVAAGAEDPRHSDDVAAHYRRHLGKLLETLIARPRFHAS